MQSQSNAAPGSAVQTDPNLEASLSSLQGALPDAASAISPAAPASAASPPLADIAEATTAGVGDSPPATVFAPGSLQVGEGGEGGDPGGAQTPAVTNAEFVAAVFRDVPDGAVVALCSKRGDPERGGWKAMAVADVDDQCPPNANNYACISSFYPGDDGSIKARKESFAALHVISIDDLGTKVPTEVFGDFEFSFVVETSPGNCQAGIVLDPPIADLNEAERLLHAFSRRNLSDPGARGATRWARLPVGINGKAKYRGKDGAPFACHLVHWNPDRRRSMQEVVAAFALDLTPARRVAVTSGAAAVADTARDHGNGDDVFTPRPAENPVVAALKVRGLYKRQIEPGKHDITCPWLQQHTDAVDHGTAYFEPDERHSLGGFCCQHSHGDLLHIRDLLKQLGVSEDDARRQDVIRARAGSLHRVVRAAERLLAAHGGHYQAGGLIVTIALDPVTGDPSIVPTTQQALTKVLAQLARWEKFDGRTGAFVVCDPPQRHISILYDARHFDELPVLSGLARQPYFREQDGALVTQPGYDPVSQRYGAFEPGGFPLPEPTVEAARAALALLLDLISEFHFVSEADCSAAISAMFTAAVRTTLDFAPGFHAWAPVFASGKSLLCAVIGAFAGPGGNHRVSYPATSEEATKVLLSLLLTGPAVVEFDDMDGDWIPHGVIKRIFTSSTITERILGFSKTATVSTRVLFLGSGNNVGPVRDLLRRVATIRLDPRCATPATLTYARNPLDLVRRERGRYVAAVLTIIAAWRRAGSPRAAVEHIASFGGAWSDYCRHPLLWLGLPDPATSLLHQVRHDPDAEALGHLMTEWRKAFGASPVTVRRAIQAAEESHPDLLDALHEFPIFDRGVINRSKFGWVLRKNANRIIGGFEFQRCEADGRTAWRVVPATPPVRPVPPAPPAPPSPASPGSGGADDENSQAPEL